MTKMIIDQLKSSNRGKIVFISSAVGLQPYKNSTAYVSSKYAIRGFGLLIMPREELCDHGQYKSNFQFFQGL